MNLLSRATKCPGGRFLSSTRIFRSSASGMATKSNSSNNGKHFLVNEALVHAIRRRAPRHTQPHDIQVRLLVNHHPQTNEGGHLTPSAHHPTNTITQLLSLPQAVQLSVQQKMDLIGISLEQDVPVIRMDHWNSFLYKQEKENNSRGTTRRVTKEVHMQHKIAPHDMERKLQQVNKFLDKGHICVIKMPLLLLDAILTKLPPQAELMHPPQIEGQKALIRVHAK